MKYEEFVKHVEGRITDLSKRDNIDYFYIDPDYHDDFTYHDCDVCLQAGAGSRYRLIGMRPDKEIIEYLACEDCMQLLEFGCVEDYQET
jgi:hypothetical protein